MSAAVAAMAEAMAPRGPDGAGVWSQGRVALGHRRLKIIDLSEAGAQPMVDAELGLTVVFNGCIYNYQELRQELHRPGLPLLLPQRHRGRCSRRYHRLGRPTSSTTSWACSPSRSSSATAAGWCSAATGSASSRCTWPRTPTALALRLVAAGAAGRRRRRHPIDPVALHHYLTLPLASCRRRAPSCAASPSCRRPRRARSSRTARIARARLLGPGLHPRRRTRRLVRTGLGGRGSGRRCAPPSSAGWSPTSRSAAALRRARLQPDRRAARRGRPDRAADVLHRLRVGRRRGGRRVRVLRPRRRSLRHRPPPDPHRHRPDAARARRRRSAR